MNQLMIRRAALAVSLTALLSACSLTPAYQRPVTEVPDHWSATPGEAPTGQPADVAWWEQFGDPELTSLMRDALAGSNELAASIARVDQARAAVRVAGAALLPSVDGSGSVSRRTDDPHGGPSSKTNAYSVGATASYELDLWGKNRAQVEAARADYQGTVFDHEALRLVVESEVATDYMDLMALRERLSLARDNLKAARDLLDLVELRYKEGAISALDVAQQRGAVASFEAQVPALEQQAQATEHALALLAGRAPQTFAVAGTPLTSVKLPVIGVEQPSQLLLRRPDLRSAEQALIAANADIGAARAAFFPTISLTAGGGLAGSISPNATSTFTSLAAGLAAPIFRGGELTGNLQRAKARQRELAADYRQAVITAFGEAEDALVAVQKTGERYDRLAEAAAQARETYRIAHLRYKEGAEDFLTVLDAQRSLFDAEDSLAQARAARFDAAVSLFKAMAGGWSTPG
ncbi:MAG: efflux transporter outer membrane subunit [Alphaproteobacteria bacterium]|nr:efflux transporter outer membrane subunit [Alphaproteobacteria bacterium]